MTKDIVFKTPPKINSTNIALFLKMAEPIFQMVDKRVPNVTMDTTSTHKADIIGLLLIYKFYEITVHKSCFKNPKSKIKGYVSEALHQYGLKELVDSFITYKNKPQYNKLKPAITDALFLSPILLERDSPLDEVAIAGVDICKYYNEDKDIRGLVLTCMGELAQNFKAHAKSDTTSILSVRGTHDIFEIACVDSGDGIVTTLRESFIQRGNKVRDCDILSKSLIQGVTSKDASSGHMGYGLWLIKELVLASKGELQLFSEGYFVHCHNGRIKNGISPYWKGTIVYMKLPLTKAHILVEFINSLRPHKVNIKLRKI